MSDTTLLPLPLLKQALPVHPLLLARMETPPTILEDMQRTILDNARMLRILQDQEKSSARQLKEAISGLHTVE